MGFSTVFLRLQEAFPQVDNRILRAVAIEHPKDVDVAAEAVIVEVLPFLPKQKVPSGSLVDSTVEAPDHHGSGEVVPPLNSNLENEMSGLNDSPFSNATGNVDQVYSNEEVTSLVNEEATCLEPGLEVTSSATSITASQENLADIVNNHLLVNFATEEDGPLLDIRADSSACQGASAFLTDEAETQSFTMPLVAANGMCHQGQVCVDDEQLKEDESFVQLASSSVQGSSIGDPEGVIQSSVMPAINTEELPQGSAVSSSAMSDDFGNESALNSVVNRSAQVCSVDLLEDIIEDARNNKKTLFLAMESVISMMKEVELQEKQTEEAKEEALRGGLETHSRMEELKEMLKHAKEANDMHAGEVYGEKAILATEARELQSRLLSLSDERNKSLAILDEMRQTLEERLDAAEKERKLAEEAKMAKEAVARDAYAEQERIMEKVVEESKLLKQQAEENSKLQEFLMDRGRVVDTLQGEISVICQDVKLLKEQFDNRVPLSKSLSLGQTTCLLAASSSSASLKSVASSVADPSSSVNLGGKELSRESSSSMSSSQFSQREERKDGNDDCSALSDDGWELFDRAETQGALVV